MKHAGRPKDCKYIYKDADGSFVLNDGDIDLEPIRISLPKPPEYHLIDGYGLPPEEQYFRRLTIPESLKDLEKVAKKEIEERGKQNKNYTPSGDKVIQKFWEVFERERKPGFDEVAEFIKTVHWCRIHGYWFFNDGKPTYVTGDYFDYLNFWTFQDERGKDGGHVEYRDVDRRRYLAREYAKNTTESVILKDDKPVVKDIGMKVCYGTGEPKGRRGGITGQALQMGYKHITSGFGRYFTIVSMEGNNAEMHYKKKLVPAWSNYPLWLQPIYSGSTGRSILFDVSNKHLGIETLGSVMDYTDSGGERANDGDKLHFALLDEEGKCFGYGTKCLMYDGSIKEVQDVVDGDVLMGDDGDKRNVVSIARGRAPMYKIIPKKGEPWICNDEHILTLSVSDKVKDWRVGDIIDIPLKEYLSFHERHRKAMCLYRTGVNYPAVNHDISPYMLGVWLGDGSTNSGQITSQDKEIYDAIQEMSTKLGLKITTKKIIEHCIYSEQGNTVYEMNGDTVVAVYNSQSDAAKAHGRSDVYIKRHSNKCEGLWFDIKDRAKPFVTYLREIGVFGDKHIPDSYMIDSRENRLQLLAGLIDTDGYAATGKKHNYEITQKRKQLALDIQRLAMSLGFHANFNSKMARMKRADGSVYECEVYRVVIYGNDLWKIPCRIPYKKYEKWDIHKNARNPLKFGFSVEALLEDNYYGFIIDGNHRFLLADYTVVHNTTSSNILERWNVNKQAMSLGGGSDIIGFSIHPTTVEEMNEGGLEYYKLMNQSKFYSRNENGQTTSGLFEFFFPAWDGMQGFVDRFGMSVVDAPTKRQRELSPNSLFAKKGIGSKKYLQNSLDVLLKQGTPEAMETYRSLRRKFPIQYSDCWLGTSGDVGFDVEILDKRMAELRRKSKVRTGWLRWTHGFGSPVHFIDDPEGAFEISKLLPDGEANRVMEEEAFDMLRQNWVTQKRPMNPYRFTVGIDPFRYGTSNAAKQNDSHSRQSDGGIAVLWERDGRMDQSQNRRDWDSDRFVLSYRYRPSSLDAYCEDVLKTCIYFGGMLYMERNVERVWEYFVDHGYGGYLLYEIDRTTGKQKDKPGFMTFEQAKNDLFALTKDYIRYRGHKEEHLSYLQECKDIRGLEQMGKFDRFTAHGACLLGSQQNYYNILREKSHEQPDGVIEDIVGFFDNLLC